MTVNRVVYTLGVALLFCAGSHGQETLSTLRGTATDASGSLVPNVAVTVQEVSTNILARKVVTDNQGNYEIPALKQGTYRLTAAVPGFRIFAANNIILDSNQVRRIDIRLEVGATESEVTVTASAAVIETEQGKIAADFHGDRYKDIPIPGNSYGATTTVLAVMPTVQTVAGSQGSPRLGGHGSNQVDMGTDGIKEETLNSQTINMEFVEELKLVAVNNTAEYSRIGYFDTVTKHGSNQFHAEASYYHRNSSLGARGFYEQQKTRQLYHTFNLSGSGPLIKNKTFFYALWNGERVPGKSFMTANVPTTAERAGDFSQLLALSRAVTILDPLTGSPFPGNIIPTNRLNPVASKVQDQYLPLPNLGAAGSLVNNFAWVHPYPGDQYHADVVTTRIDHKISDSNSLYGRFSAYLPRYVLAGTYPALARTKLRQSHSWSVVDTHVISPRLVNTFTFGGNRDASQDDPEVDGHLPPSGAQVVSALGITGVNPKNISTPGGFPVMAITGIGTLRVQPGGPTVARSFTFADSLSWSHGRHVVKLGGELRTYSNFSGVVPEGSYGSFTFDGSLTGNGYSDFLLGLPYSSLRLDPFYNRTTLSKELGLYVTDTFKVSQRLTIDYGLRWDYFLSPKYADDLEYNWDSKTGNVIVSSAASSKVSPLYPSTITVATGEVVPHAEKTNFAPRLAAAYRVSDKMVVRGGWGIFNEFLGRFARAQGTGPFQITETFFNSVAGGRPLFQFPNPFPTGSGSIPSQSVGGYPLDTKNGWIEQFNITIERQVHDVGLRLAYIGSRDYNLNYDLSIDKPMPSTIPFAQSRRPYPQFVGATFSQTNGRAKYDSMLAEAQRRVGAVSFDANWTWAHAMTNFGDLENPYDPNHWNRDFYPKHRVVLNILWQLPFGKGAHFLANAPRSVDAVIGGWKLAWVSILQTGQYFTPSFSGADPSGTNTSGGLPDRIANGNLPTDQRTLAHWFDTSAFVRPPVGRFGNSGVNILQGPGEMTQNVSLSKRFMLTEHLHLDFMTMVSNLFNHPNFNFPAANISAPGQAGVITSQHGFFTDDKSGARLVELRARLEF
jgi:hypothetical protein